MIIVFARAPVLGQAKTRLVPCLGEWRAARLHRWMIARAVATAGEVGPVELHGTRPHSFFRRLPVKFRLQRGRDLGERMHHALARSPRPALLIGSDCPALTAGDLRQALRLLRGGYDAVLAPADDGGYALVGVRHPIDLFSRVDWGTSRVYEQTAGKLNGYRWRALRTLWDVDRPADLERLRALRFASAFRRGARRSRGSRARWGGSDRP
jgi:rSAM/selenodomain-associated transferase 1